MDQPTGTPTRKVLVGGFAGAIMTVIAWLLQAVYKVEVPAEIALAASTVLVFLLQYMIPNAEV